MEGAGETTAGTAMVAAVAEDVEAVADVVVEVTITMAEEVKTVRTTMITHETLMKLRLVIAPQHLLKGGMRISPQV